MKIYFAGSIRGGRDDVATYSELISHLRQYGVVLTEHVGESTLSHQGENHLSPKAVHDRDMQWLLSADVIIAEVTVPSLGVGYELGRAVEHGKRILCLFRNGSNGGSLSMMVAGSDKLDVRKYSTLEEAKSIVSDYFMQIKA
jgi:nucleoside 2-deoxyribosyltransferase